MVRYYIVLLCAGTGLLGCGKAAPRALSDICATTKAAIITKNGAPDTETDAPGSIELVYYDRFGVTLAADGGHCTAVTEDYGASVPGL